MAATAQAILQVKAQGAAQTNQEFQNLRKNITGNMTAAERSVASALSSMAAQYISLGLVIRQVGKTLSQGVEFNKFMESQTMAFEVMMKSADKAKAKVKELYDFAVVSPLTFKETVSSSKQLMAYGFAAEELVPTMEKLGSVAIATGHSLSDLAYVYGTLKSQGRAYSRDLLQFGMRGIPIYEELAKVLKVNVNQIQKMASEGKIGFAEVEKAFANMTDEGGRFGGILDKYMETLTGKLAMLSDIWEQSTGKMAEGLSKVLGKAVDEFTAKLESGELDGFIQSVSDNVAGLANALLNTIKTLIEIAPVLSVIAKTLIEFKILSLIVGWLVKLPALIKSTTAALKVYNAILLGIPVATTGAITSIGALATALKALLITVATNPIVIAIVAIGAAATATFKIINSEYDKLKTKLAESDERMIAAATKSMESRAALLLSVAQAQRGNKVAQGFVGNLSDNVRSSLKIDSTDTMNMNFGKAQELAKQFAISIEDTLLALFMADAVTEKNYSNMMNHLAEQKKMQEQYTEEARRMAPANQQMDFLAGLTGVDDPKIFLDTADKYTALGGKGAKMYIAGFEAERDKKKNLLGDLFTDKMMTDSLKTEMDSLYESLFAGMDLDAMVIEFDEAGELLGATLKDGAFYEFSTFDETIMARIREITGLLDDEVKKPLVELSKWWLPEEAKVKATLDAFDDIGLELRKQLATLDEETEKRLDIIATMDETADKARLLHELAKDRAQAEKDIFINMQRQADILKYQENLTGGTNYWQGIQAQAGQGDMGAVAMTSMEGTQIGSAMAGGDPMTMVIKALADFAMTIENISKLMAPLNTILEAGRPLFELFINSALQDMVNWLSALGVIIGKILAPIMSLTQLFFLFSNVLYNMLLIPLEGLGTAFAWLNDSVIAPVGNGLIDLINKLFTWVNKLLGTNVPLIESLKKTTDASNKLANTLNNAISNATNALTSTISFLLDKFNSYIDEQVGGYQDLYEVGAISGAEYEKAVKSLGNRLDPSTVNISAKDKALETQFEIAARLAQLYGVQEKINTGNLTEEEKLKLLKDVGMVTESVESAMMKAAFEAALKAYGASTDATIKTIGAWGGVNDSGSTKTPGTGRTQIPYTGSTGLPETNPDTGVTIPGAGSGGGPEAYTIPKSFMAQYEEALRDPLKFFKQYGIQYINRTLLAINPQQLFNMFQVPYTGSATRGQIDDAQGQAGVNLFTLMTMPAFAKGTTNVPFDMSAIIHEGEGIIPKTFMDGVRSGEISIGRGSSNGGVYVTVNVAGNVTAENDLAVTIAEVLYNERRSGRLTA